MTDLLFRDKEFFNFEQLAVIYTRSSLYNYNRALNLLSSINMRAAKDRARVCIIHLEFTTALRVRIYNLRSNPPHALSVLHICNLYFKNTRILIIYYTRVFAEHNSLGERFYNVKTRQREENENLHAVQRTRWEERSTRGETKNASSRWRGGEGGGVREECSRQTR